MSLSEEDVAVVVLNLGVLGRIRLGERLDTSSSLWAPQPPSPAVSLYRLFYRQCRTLDATRIEMLMTTSEGLLASGKVSAELVERARGGIDVLKSTYQQWGVSCANDLAATTE